MYEIAVYTQMKGRIKNNRAILCSSAAVKSPFFFFFKNFKSGECSENTERCKESSKTKGDEKVLSVKCLANVRTSHKSSFRWKLCPCYAVITHILCKHYSIFSSFFYFLFFTFFSHVTSLWLVLFSAGHLHLLQTHSGI